MANDNLTILQRVHRNYAMFQDHTNGMRINDIAIKYGLTYQRTRVILKEHTMKQYFVVDIADDFVLYEGTLTDCEAVLEESYAGLAIVGYRDLTSGMLTSLKNLREQRKNDKLNPSKNQI